MPELTSCCPYLKRVANERHYSIQGYCQRPLLCELRVPSISEFRHFCTTGNYYHCPLYRSGTEAGNGHGRWSETR
jgi:hypothetical protein